jgi:histidine ammonia-lyase/phenylalanine ammonia-lyase
MNRELKIDNDRLHLADAFHFVLDREAYSSVQIGESCLTRIRQSETHLYNMIEKRLPIYGVTTGFGDSCFRFIEPKDSFQLQSNLISYLLVGTGPLLSIESSRALMLFRFKSLSRGFSGVSVDLIQRLQQFVERDWVPVIPCEGSLGASGDLIPLAYLAQALQGQGRIYVDGKIRQTREVLHEAGVAPYVLKPKEGLALVNGTSAMSGLCLTNLAKAKGLFELATLSSAWLCLALRGRTEAFGAVVNEKAGRHPGQAEAANAIMGFLRDEKYQSKPLSDVQIKNSQTNDFVQDRYSLRCSPQILGPINETMTMLAEWLECEVNSTSDNPLIDDDGSLNSGGNFYGGYLSQGMDYLKISLAHIADMLDRQLAMLIDDKSNRGLPANLANWPGMPEDQRFLHHGLKGLHQAVSAITSEIMSKSVPNGVFSRSAESHNQDKVSLGMSAAVQCEALIDQLYTTQTLYLVCLAQALDLRGVVLQGERSQNYYRMIRAEIPFVAHDQSLGEPVERLREKLKKQSVKNVCLANVK